MKFCQNCGKQLPDEYGFCNSCGARFDESNNGNVPVESTEMKTEYQPGENPPEFVQPNGTTDEYLSLISNAKITNLISIGVLALGVLSLLFINGWLGAVLCLVAEIVAVIPNTKVHKLFKSKNSPLDKNTFKANLKMLQNDLKLKSKDFKTSFLIALIALVLLVVFVVTNSAISSWADSLPEDLQKESYGSGIVEQIDTISDLHQYSNTDMYNNSKDDEDGVSKETVDNAYYPTIDEFVEDYIEAVEYHIGFGVSCRTEDSADKTIIYVSFCGTEYMTIECVLDDVGKIKQVGAKIKYGLYSSSHNITESDMVLNMSLSEVTLPSFIILGYQNGPGYGTGLEKATERSKELVALADKNKISDTYCMATNTYENCLFTFSISTETPGWFSCSCTIFPKDDNGDSTEKTTGKNESTQNSSAQNSSTQTSAPVIGGFSYSFTLDMLTKTKTDPVYPYFNNLRFKADGTAIITAKDESGFVPIEGVWELSESESGEGLLVYRFKSSTSDETIPIYYEIETDFCMMYGLDNTANCFQRYTSDK